MEQYCITLEQAKKLDKLNEDSEFCWYEIRSDDKGVLAFFNHIPSWLDHKPVTVYPAYHVGELGEILRHWTENIEPDLDGDKKIWVVKHDLFDPYTTEAQARGALLIYLLENKLLELL